jgi:glycosyltransferase involved in cell wall biosynthesis
MLSTMPRVSVIIPNYNHAPYLKQRIGSVLEQTFQDFEVILLDDYSTDDSRAILSEYASLPRVKVVFNESNGGSVFKQWNKGLRMAAGEYVWIAESDDYADPEFLATLVGILDRNPKLGLAFCDSWRVLAGEIQEAGELWYGEFEAHYKCDFSENGISYVCRQMAFFGTIPNASAVVFRRSVALDSGFADEGFRLAGDWLFWLNILLRADMAYSSRRLNFYRYHLQTARHKHAKDGVLLEESLQIVDFLFSNFPLEWKAQKRIRTCWSEWFIETMMQRDSALPLERRKILPKLARRVEPWVDIRFFLRITGLRRLFHGSKKFIRKLRTAPHAI